MKPTNELRFVERELQTPHPTYANVTKTEIVHILQQKWAVHNQNIVVGYEWRDVPLEKDPKG
jgi:hypothetical protein